MAITEDTGNQPAAKTFTGAWTSAQTTASFSPQANTLLVALVSADGGATGVTASVTDSLGGTWTMLLRANTATTAFGTAEVWVRYLSSAPGSMTVSVVKATGTAANGGQLTVRCLLGAASTQSGATGTVVRDSAGTIQASVAAGTGGWIYGAAYNWSNSTAMTVLGNTTSITAFVDSTNGDNWAAFKSSAATAGTATYGYSTSVQGSLAAVEIQAATSTNFTQTVNDGTGLTDVASQLLTAVQAFTDLTGSTDAVSQVASAVQAFTDSTGSTDTVTRVAAASQAFTDPASTTDSASRVAAAISLITDGTGSTDNATQVVSVFQTIADGTGLTDSMSQSGAVTVYRLWPSTNGPALDAADYSSYTMCMQFSLSSAASLTAVYWWRATAVSPAPTLCGVYDVLTSTLVATAESFANPGIATGWIRQQLATPVALTAGTNYKIAVFGNPIGYSGTSAYWSSGDGAAGITTGIITAPNNGTASGGQDSFNTSTSMAYPNSNFGAANYWVDLEVQTGGTPVNYTQTITDGAGNTDSAAQLLTAAQTFTDPTGSTDVQGQAATAAQSFTDSTGSTDSVAQQATNSFAQTFTDGTGSTDQVIQLAASVRSFTDPTSSTDSLTSGATVPRTVNDDTGSTDLGQSYQADYTETLTDPTGSTDNVSQQSSSAGGQTFTDNVGVTDSVSQQSVTNYTYTITDSTGTTDATATALARSLTDPTGSTDTASQVTNQTRVITDDAGSSDTVNQQQSSAGGQIFTDATGSTDTAGQAISYFRALSDEAGSTDTMSQQSSSASGQTFVDSTGSTDAVLQVVTYAVTITDSTGSTDVMIQPGQRDIDIVNLRVEPGRLSVSVESGRGSVTAEGNP